MKKILITLSLLLPCCGLMGLADSSYVTKPVNAMGTTERIVTSIPAWAQTNEPVLINAINAKIPSEAAATNQLADKAYLELFTSNAIANSAATLAMQVASTNANHVTITASGNGDNRVYITVEDKTVSALVVSNATSAAVAAGVTNGMLLVWNGTDRYLNKAGQTIMATPTNFVWNAHQSIVTNECDCFVDYFYVRGTLLQPSQATNITNGVTFAYARDAHDGRRDDPKPPYQPKGWGDDYTPSKATIYHLEGRVEKHDEVVLGPDGTIIGLAEIMEGLKPEQKNAMTALQEAFRAKEMVKELSNNCITDLKWDATAQKLTWKGSSSSGGKEQSATLSYKLKSNNETFWLQTDDGTAKCGDIIKRARGDSKTITTSGDKVLSVKAAPKKGLEATDTGVAIKTFSDSGIGTGAAGVFVKCNNHSITRNSDGIDVNAADGGAIYKGTTGIGVNLTRTGGLKGAFLDYSNTNGISIKPKEKGGIKTDMDGVFVQMDPEGGITCEDDDKGIKVHVDDSSIVIVDNTLCVLPGKGITIGSTVLGGSGVEVKPKESDAIVVDEDGVGVSIAENGAITKNGGLSVVSGNGLTKDGNSLAVLQAPNGGINVGANGVSVNVDGVGVVNNNGVLGFQQVGGGVFGWTGAGWAPIAWVYDDVSVSTNNAGKASLKDWEDAGDGFISKRKGALSYRTFAKGAATEVYEDDQKVSYGIEGWTNDTTSCNAKLSEMLMDPGKSTDRERHKFLCRYGEEKAVHYLPIGDLLKGDERSVDKVNDGGEYKFVVKGAKDNGDKLLQSGGSGANKWLTIGQGLEASGGVLKATAGTIKVSSTNTAAAVVCTNTLRFVSAPDSNVQIDVSDAGNGNVEVKIGVYWK